jgi:hypothetical protein
MPIPPLTGLYIDQTYSRLVQTQGGEFANGLGQAITLVTSTGSLVTTSSFNAFTSSYNTGSFTGSFTGSLFGTASFAVSASRAVISSLSLQNVITASVSLNTITFTKGDNTTFPITVNTGSFTGSFNGVVAQPVGTGQLVYGEGSTIPPEPPVNYTISSSGIYKIEGGDPLSPITPTTPYLFFPDPVIEGATITVITTSPSGFSIDINPRGTQIVDASGTSISSLAPNRIYNFYGIGNIWYGGYLT